ncbi:MAG: Bax inhibitor-1/YccA family protein [Pseudomonadota bacterium]
MANSPQTYGTRTVDTPVDQGLRAYMLGIYNYMAGGIALTGLMAYLVFSFAVTSDPAQAVATLRDGVYLTQLGSTLFISPLKWVVMLSPLAFVMFLSFGMNRMSVGTAQMLFWAFAAVMGLSMGSIFIVFTTTSIGRVFFITAAAFGALSLYGYTTKRDLSAFGSFLFMGLIGIVIASLVNLFLQSTAMQFVLSVLGVLIFSGLTAWDTQRLKESYYENMGQEAAAKLSIVGALSLYLNFINLFQSLLMIFGDRR